MDENSEKIRTKEELIKFLYSLSEDCALDRANWQNKCVSQYLESIAAWLEDIGDFTGDRIKIEAVDGELLSYKVEDSAKDLNEWQKMAELFLIGKYYE